MKSLLTFFTCLIISSFAFAARGGGGGGAHSLAFGLGIATAAQDDLDNHSDYINTLGGGRGATKVGTGMEYTFQYQYRMSGTIFGLVFRPSYFTQEAKGGTDKTSLTGMTFFPMLRLYPLENSFIHFYMQAGLGYGKLSGKVEQASGTVEFSGSAFGAAGGLGAEFCFTPDHCMFLEGNFRYLPIERNVTSANSTTAEDGFSQAGAGQELEYSNTDVKTSMSGIVGSIGYMMNF